LLVCPLSLFHGSSSFLVHDHKSELDDDGDGLVFMARSNFFSITRP
jgi:hypothetical protein